MSAGCIRKFFVRLSHRRGHSIHSPFVYGIIRNVYTKRRGIKGDMYRKLTEAGVKPHYAREIEGLYEYLNLDGYSIDGRGNGELAIITQPGFCNGITGKYAICFTAPRMQKNEIGLLMEGPCTVSIDRKGYVILFYDDQLPKQHFIL